MLTDPCNTCPHQFHGLPCQRPTYLNPMHPYQATPCTCPGPWATTEETP